MTDPEIEYARLVSGNAAAVHERAADLEAVLHDLVGIRSDLADAQEVPVWLGPAAMSFHARAAGLRQGLSVTRVSLERARGALETAATAYETCEAHADHYIGFWRNRPPVLPPVVEELFARAVNGCLLRVGEDYNRQLAGVTAVLRGEDVDLDELDDQTRAWVEEGLAKNEEWLEGNDSSLGPLIPNTAATGDDRGLIPQGLGYDPDSGTLLQGYYTDDKKSYLALIDEVTGQEIGEVRLGGYDGQESSSGGPTHAGGVSIDGDNVYVVDNGEVYTYSLADVRSRGAGETVPQSAPPQTGLQGGSYSAMKDGRLYLGDHGKDLLHVYERGADGKWHEVDTIETPNDCQGVVVRDDELVFSSSYGRHQDHSSLIVQDMDGNRQGPYHLPSMSQGVVEVDGGLITTYESGAGKFDHAATLNSGWFWGLDDYRDLWANPHMTRTPLSELGLTGEVEVEAPTLSSAADDFAAAGDDLVDAARDVRTLRVPDGSLGRVPQASALVRAVEDLTGACGESLGAGGRAADAVGVLLRSSATDYLRTDEHVQSGFRGLAPE